MMNNRNYFEVWSQLSYFPVELYFVLDGKPYKIGAKFDTGCSMTMISYKSLGISDSDRLYSKEIAIKRYRNGELSLTYSKGVESEDIKLPSPYSLTDDELMESTYICFKYYVDDFSVCKCGIGKQAVKVSYDRTGHSLLGMNIINNYDIHIGSDTLDMVLLGTQREQEDKSTYYALLEKYFSLEPCGRGFARSVRDFFGRR